ncbi:capsular polysaccharide synthesis protein [Arthrobacter rhombi]|uniref:capsular polysaccharide synthesis protein n=1 Tax=Arthrobacter rhombi TaxID=71253 RepID=UPI003FD53D97
MTLVQDENAKQAKRLYRKAKLAERAGDFDECIHLNAQALALDATASQADWNLLHETPRHFRERRALFRVLSVHVDEMASRAKKEEAKFFDEAPFRVFVYWAQGFDDAPGIVKACKAEAERLHQAGDIVYLDDSNLNEWVDLPAHVYRIRDSSRAAFSDVLRVALLAKHGGVWMDATCMPTRRMQDVMLPLIKGSGFFAFAKQGNASGMISSWFMAAHQGSYIAVMHREALFLYCAMYDRVITYFFMHEMFRQIFRLDGKFNRLWMRTPDAGVDPRAVNRILREPLASVDLDAAFAGSFVHKLTYKVPPELEGGTVFRTLEKLAV